MTSGRQDGPSTRGDDHHPLPRRLDGAAELRGLFGNRHCQDDRPGHPQGVSSGRRSPMISSASSTRSSGSSSKAAICSNWTAKKPCKWDSLSGPPLERLLYHLRNDEDCKDLNNFAMVSPHYRKEAKVFTKKANNRPGIKRLTLQQSFQVPGSFLLEIDLYPSNIPFYDLIGLDRERFERGEREETDENGESIDRTPVLRVILNGPQDPAVEQLANLLSTTIQSVEIIHASLNSFTVVEQLLRNATIGYLYFMLSVISDATAPIILNIVSHLKPRSNRLDVLYPNMEGLSDPEPFVISLCEGITSIFLRDLPLPIFGLPNSFWEKYLNAKLSSGSVGWIQVDYAAGKITKAPFAIDPNRRIGYAEWGQSNDM